MFQRPERASFISTKSLGGSLQRFRCMFQRPERASFISTLGAHGEYIGEKRFNALNGLLSFLL